MPRRTRQSPSTRTGVNSTCLRAVKHDKASKRLECEFRKGSIYEYRGVSTRTANGLKNADSVGRYFNRNVRNNYAFTRLRGGRPRRGAKRKR